jgi:hypothetical protein
MAALLAFGITLSSVPSWSCGPFFETATFSYTDHPDFPLFKYASGDLGVLQPTYARSYLVVAYRYLSGKPLDAPQQNAFIEFWKSRLNQSDQYPNAYSPSESLTAWLKVRKQVLGGDDPKIDTYRNASKDPQAFYNFENCPPATFQNAVQTIKNRMTKFGADSANVKEWAKGQDNVFCHCTGPQYDYKTKTMSAEGPFPTALPQGADPLLKADRDYQIASAHFYAMQYDKAASEFRAIAEDKNSPWNSYGSYLAARALVRKGTTPDPIDTEALSKAKDLLNSIVKDPKLESVHKDATGLLQYLEGRLDPEKRLLALTNVLFDPADAGNFQQNLTDYIYLLSPYFPDSDPYSDVKAKPKDLSQSLRSNDLTDWLATFNGNSVEDKSQVIEKWRKTRSMPWLIAALNAADGKSVVDKDLLAAAHEVPSSSVGYPTVAFHLARLAAAENQIKNAQEIIQKVETLKLPPSAVNSFGAIKLNIASTLQEFVKLAVRHPAGYDYDYSPYFSDKKIFDMKDYAIDPRSCFVPLAADILNYETPLEKLKSAALECGAATAPKFDFTQAVFTRAVLLKKYDLAQSLVPSLKILRPQLASMYDAFANASTPADKQFAAYFLMLRNPGSRPFITPGAARDVDYGKLEDYGDNWWSSKGLTGDSHFTDRTAAKPKLPKAPSFLSDADLKAANDEMRAVKALGEAPNILSSVVLDYAKSHPTDARISEALHRCVRATKLGSTDGNTSKYSKQAFALLHKQYGTTQWAKNTPYYY